MEQQNEYEDSVEQFKKRSHGSQGQQAMMQQQIAQQQADTALTQGQAMNQMGQPETQEGMEKAEQSAKEQGLI